MPVGLPSTHITHVSHVNQIAIHVAERSLLLSSNQELRDANQQLRDMTESLQGMLRQALETNDKSVTSHTRQLKRQGEALSHLLHHIIEEREGVVQQALQQLDQALLAHNEAEAEAALATIESEEPELLTRLKNMAERTMSTGTGFMLKELLERLFGL